MKSRPKRTAPDANQKAEHAKLTGWGCVCYDVHNLPGNETANPLDEFILSPCKRFLLQVEWKARPGASFTPNEKVFFKSLGIWDLLQLWLDPVALWRQTGIPVIVAWKAKQIMEVFEAMAGQREPGADAGECWHRWSRLCGQTRNLRRRNVHTKIRTLGTDSIKPMPATERSVVGDGAIGTHIESDCSD